MIAIGSALVMVLMGLVAVAPSAFADTYTLWAGQNIEAGSITVTHDADNVYLTYATIDGWEITATNFYVGKTDPNNEVDALSSAPGQFPYNNQYDPAITSITYTIALDDLDSYSTPKGAKWAAAGDSEGAALGSTIYIATHAEAQKEVDGTIVYESAWCEGQEFGKGWAMFATYKLEQELMLIQKDTNNWEPLPNGVEGTLNYRCAGPEFVFDFYAEDLADGDYSLVYYADGVFWQTSTKLIASGTSTGGILDFSGSVNLNLDLPRPDDKNNINNPDKYTWIDEDYNGAKIWLIPSGDFVPSGTAGFGWVNNANQPDYLWEDHLIIYDDTDLS
jgi:hypothetical protein